MFEIVIGTISIITVKSIIEYYMQITINNWFVIGIMILLYMYKISKEAF